MKATITLHGAKTYVQDLCQDEAREITDQVTICGKELQIPGQLIEDLADGAPKQEKDALPGIMVCINA